MPADDTTLEDLDSLFSADQIQQTIQVAAHHQLAKGATANQVREHAKELTSLGKNRGGRKRARANTAGEIA
jgi:hypothetical protein